ncbi:hypothetical protein BJ944DRAFT_243512 [Cunninghamella echinulata]|nr:hypothetical protein BJ944DRAFT_243512 [Cunninghamella echinulata]
MSSSITTQSEYINSYKRDDTLDISSSVISTSTSSRPRRVMPSTTKSPRKQKLDLPMDPVRIECYSKMREQRTNLKSKFNVSNITTIYSDNELKLLVLNDIPTNQQEYLNILPDQKKYQNYGKYFLTLCRQYAKKL